MDPITAVSLVSAVFSFVDFGFKLVRGARAIHKSASGTPDETRTQEVVIGNLKELCIRLTPPRTDVAISGEDASLCELAAECRDLSDQFIALIQKGKPGGRTSWLRSTSAAFSKIVNESKTASLEQRLENCRRQLEFHVRVAASSRQDAGLQAIQAAVAKDSARVQRLAVLVEDLQANVRNSSFSHEAKDDVQRLVTLHDNALNSILQHRVLQSLMYETMYHRQGAVANASRGTFDWFLTNDQLKSSNQDLDAYKQKAKQRFLAWLASGTGIFHISGKLGSGKSTLMKFLSTNELTEKHLRQWAGQRSVVMVRFFFWKPGNELQKTMRGLLRSLLHDISEHCPHIIPDVLPNAWHRAGSSPWEAQAQLHVSEQEIEEAFKRVIKHPTLFDTHCLCLFIDGLDEYEGTPSMDQRHLVDELADWGDAAPSGVKICVSSRPDNVFLNAFPSSRRICLHDLTRRDMHKYIMSNLRHMNDIGTRGHLADILVDKAQGIFLWLALVVRSIREKLENGSSSTTILEDVDRLPKELFGLFTHILQNLDSPRRGHQILAITQLANKYQIELEASAYACLEDYDKDPGIQRLLEDVRAGLFELDEGSLTRKGCQMLRANTGGLVEDRPTSQRTDKPWPSKSGRKPHFLRFTHRSVTEFLDTYEYKQSAIPYTSGFNIADAISKFYLVRLHFDLLAHHRTCSRRQTFFLCKYAYILPTTKLMGLWQDFPSDGAAIRFWEYVELIISERREGRVTSENLSGLGEVFLVELDGEHCIRVGISSHHYPHRKSHWDSPSLPPVFFAELHGLPAYSLWKVENDLKFRSSPANLMALLFCSALRDQICGSEKGQCTRMMKYMLERGLVYPHLSTDLWMGYFDKQERTSLRLSLWQQFLVLFISSIAPGSSTAEQRRYIENVSETIKLLLEFGADPRLLIAFFRRRERESPAASEHDIFYVRISGPGIGPEVCLRLRGAKTVMRSHYLKLFLYYDLVGKAGEKSLSVRDWVTGWEDWVPQKESVLRLIDENTRRLDLSGNEKSKAASEVSDQPEETSRTHCSTIELPVAPTLATTNLWDHWQYVEVSALIILILGSLLSGMIS